MNNGCKATPGQCARLAIPLLLVVALTPPGLARSQTQAFGAGAHDDNSLAANKGRYSPFAGPQLPERVLWGDTHLHTRLSTDSGFLGTALGPDEAYRFARGEQLISNTGQPVRLQRPLDFLVIADHAEYMGMVDMLNMSHPALLANPTGKRWHRLWNGTEEQKLRGFRQVVASVSANDEAFKSDAAARSNWESVIALAERYNQPGVFTTLHGYEWSPLPNGNNLHRVVIFRDAADRVGQVLPFSSFDSQDPEKLWEYLQAYEDSTGGRVLAIPHNGNWSNGLMFALEDFSGRATDRSYADARRRWEPVYEVTQMKGDGETHPLLSPNDEFADFGTWDKGNIQGLEAKTQAMLPYEYARSALLLGLQQASKLGSNPFKFGMIGATDSHTGLSTSREDNFFGKSAASEPNAQRLAHVSMKGKREGTTVYTWEHIAAGLAGVWARENTREAIWDALKRKEVYATTGSRMTVRVFGGWDFTADQLERQDFARQGYARGVPMGGDLTAAPTGKAPVFLIRALRDPDNANLDRIQIIKGWLDRNGRTHERIYDVACADERAVKNRRCETPVGSTVNIADASYTNTIGDPSLAAYWKDPDFDAGQTAFYYVRVLEIPKPSWQAYDAKFYKVKPAKAVPMTVQDRAYTSPIWYTP